MLQSSSSEVLNWIVSKARFSLLFRQKSHEEAGTVLKDNNDKCDYDRDNEASVSVLAMSPEQRVHSLTREMKRHQL